MMTDVVKFPNAGELKISRNLSLPLETVTQTIGVLAKRRAGKSYLARRLAEQLFRAGQQIVIVDPKGDQWGIRSAADGKSPGLPIVIVGGEHGDIPRLEVSSGEVVAKLVVEERVSILLDLSFFRKHEVATFMTAFLESLYRLKARESFRTPMMLLIDEADAIAPQKPQKGEERMLGAAEDIVRRGGQRGIGCCLVTQRSAVLNKNVLTQVQILIALRTIAPQDLAALNAWVDVHGTPEQQKTLMESLPALPTGDAWFWSPGWPDAEGIFKRVHVLPIETFDSGATPKPGEKPVEPKHLADVDLEALGRQMAATIEKAKAEDPRELRKRIAALERELVEAKKTPAPAAAARVEVPVLTAEQVRRLDGLLEVAHQLQRGQEDVLRIVQPEVVVMQQLVDAVTTLKNAVAPKTASQPPISRRVPRGGAAGSEPAGAFDSRSRRDRIKPVRQRKPDEGRHRRPPADADRPRPAAAGAHCKAARGARRVEFKGGTFRRIWGSSRRPAGLEGDKNHLVITEEGRKALGGSRSAAEWSGELLDYWLTQLGDSGAARMLLVLPTAYPVSMPKHDWPAAELTGNAAHSRRTWAGCAHSSWSMEQQISCAPVTSCSSEDEGMSEPNAQGSMEPVMTDIELEIVLHTLGLTDPKTKEPYRNHFVSGDGNSDMTILASLCQKGFMVETRAPGFLEPGDRLFLVTDAGIFYAQKHRPKPRRLTRDQKRYGRFLELSDCHPDLTFREFLTDPQFAKYRIRSSRSMDGSGEVGL